MERLKTLKILLVDDHPLFLEGIQNLLTARGLHVVGTAGDGLEALAQARALHPNLILMDVQMPRCDGLAATRLIKAEMPDVKIVMLTVSARDQHLFEAVRSGASGYMQLFHFYPDSNTVAVSSYSPTLNQWDSSAACQYCCAANGRGARKKPAFHAAPHA